MARPGWLSIAQRCSAISLELAGHDKSYEDVATKFFEHWAAITHAINTLGGTGLWDDEDGFYYDQINEGDGAERLKIRSLVGLLPICAVEVLPLGRLNDLHGFDKRMRWFLQNRKELAERIQFTGEGLRSKALLAIPSRDQLEARAALHARRRRVFVAVWNPLAVQGSQR